MSLTSLDDHSSFSDTWWLVTWGNFLLLLVISISLKYFNYILNTTALHDLLSPTFPAGPMPQSPLMIETFRVKDSAEVIQQTLDLSFQIDWLPQQYQDRILSPTKHCRIDLRTEGIPIHSLLPHQDLISNPLITSEHCRVEIKKEMIPLHFLLHNPNHSPSPSFSSSHLIDESSGSTSAQPSPVSNVRPLWTKRGPMHWDRIYTSVP
jgi:hypothetical protein